MLGIQNTLPVTNSVKFGRDTSKNESFSPDVADYEPDAFSREDIEAERDKKLSGIDEARANFDNLADSLDKNPDTLSKKASKLVRYGSAALGLIGTFVMAKYGSKVMINTFREFGKSGFGKSVADGAKEMSGPLKKVFGTMGTAIKKLAENPIVKSLKNSKAGKMVAEFAEKPQVKSALEKLAGYKEAGKTLVKSIDGKKVQSAIENTMAASTTASVLIDDLAGRNDNKSNVELALGASGGTN